MMEWDALYILLPMAVILGGVSLYYANKAIDAAMEAKYYAGRASAFAELSKHKSDKGAVKEIHPSGIPRMRNPPSPPPFPKGRIIREGEIPKKWEAK